MKKRIVKSTSVILLGLFLFPCAISAQMKIKVGVDPTYPPMESLDEAGNMVGFDIDLIKAVAKAGDFAVSLVNVGWEEIFAELQTCQIDAIVSCVTVLATRKETMDFSIPYYDSPQVIAVQRQTTNAFTE
jgi:polar amino acid transport system substrate-binding protein